MNMLSPLQNFLRKRAITVVIVILVYRFIGFLFKLLHIVFFNGSYVLSETARNTVLFFGITDTVAMIVAVLLVRPLDKRFEKKSVSPLIGFICLLLLFVPINIQFDVIGVPFDVIGVPSTPDADYKRLEKEIGSFVECRFSCYLGTDPIDENLLLNGLHIKEALVFSNSFEEKFRIKLELTKEGGQIIKKATTYKNIGEVISFYTNDILVVSHPINGPIDQKFIMFPGAFDEDDAHTITGNINATLKGIATPFIHAN